jgi:2-iminobutanoate/2-iminopropanoate deaminase
MDRQVVKVGSFYGAVGPYSHAIKAGSFLFVSGQAALDSQTGKLAEGDVSRQAELTLRNLSRILEEAGSNLNRVVKVTVYLRSMEDYAAMNSVYRKFWPSDPPARTTVQVSGLPLDSLVEMDAIALLAD